ncbi:MAG: AsmA family protein [Desulfobacterales bacterium]
MRWKWILGIFICLIMALVAVIYILLRTYDYNKLKPRLTQMVRETTGRELNLGGEIELAVGFSPVLVVTDISFANADWGSQPQMLKIDELRAQVRLLTLLVRKVELRHFALKGVDVLLETNPDGQGNWEFPAGVASVRSAAVFKASQIDADDIRFENLDLTFRNGKSGSATRFNLADFKMARQGPDDGLAVDLKADYKAQQLTLSGKTGSVGELLESKRFPLELSGTFAHAAIKLQGAVDDVLKLEGIDLKIQTSGKNLAKLKVVNGIQLPETDAFDLKGQLKGSKAALSLNDLSGNLSGSDVNLTFSGNVGDLIAINGIDLLLKASGKDLTKIGALVDQKLPSTDEFALEGRLTGSVKALTLQAAKGRARRGALSMALDGGVENLIDLKGLDLNVHASGKNLAALGAIIEQKLPDTEEFSLQGRLTGTAKILSLSEASGSASRGSLNLTLNGKIKDLYTFSGVDLDLKGGGKNLAEIGKIIDQKLPVTDQFAVQARLTGSAKALSLKAAKGHARRGSLNLMLSGGIEALSALEGIHFALKTSGKEMAEIGPLVGTELPDLGPFDLSTTLSGSAKAISLKPFSLIVDQSDFNGRARVAFLKRPKITLRLKSSVIDFTPLMKSLEKDSEKNSQQVVKEDNQKRRLFSDDPLPFDALQKVDADIDLKAKNIHARDARLKFGHLTVMLEDGDLSIDRLEAVYQQTKISGTLKINSGEPPQAATSFLVQDLDLGNLLKEARVSDQVRAHLDIAAHGKSSGYSVQDLMSELDGSIGTVMGKGYLTNYLNLLSLDLTHKVREIWGHIKEGDQIKCAVVQFDINKGIAASRAFVFDTEAGILRGKGDINLGTEEINFLLAPTPSAPTLSFMTKLRVTGTIMDAKVRPDKLALLEKGATLLSTFVIGPLGLLAPFVRLGAHKKHPCKIKRLDELGLSVPVEK